MFPFEHRFWARCKHGIAVLHRSSDAHESVKCEGKRFARLGLGKFAAFNLCAVPSYVAAAKHGVGTDVADHDVHDRVPVACEFLGLAANGST